jgi:DNA-nicking Smr family endonuclease
MANGSDEILSFLDKYGVVNKDRHQPHKKNTKSKNTAVFHKGIPREKLDLHGLISSEASMRLRITVDRCRERGIKELLVIHGKGYHSNANEGPVLKKIVQQMLENELCLNIRDYKTALPRDGGEGATMVYLR